MTNDAHRAGAERDTNRGFLSTRRSSRQQQPGHVAAGDQQNDARRAHQYPERRPRIAHRFFEERAEDDGEVEAAIWILRALPDDVARDGFHIGSGLGKRQFGLDTGQNLVAVVAAVVRGEVLWAESQRRPHLRLVGKVKARRHDARHYGRCAVDTDSPADHARVATKGPLPQGVTENHHVVSPRLRFLGEKCPTQTRLNAQD